MFISYPLSTDSVMLLCVFFFASFSSPHVFIWLAGTVDQRPHGNAPAEWTNKHMQMWLHRSQADGSDLSSSSCSPHTVCLQAINLTHSITYTHTRVCVCMRKHWLSEPRKKPGTLQRELCQSLRVGLPPSSPENCCVKTTSVYWLWQCLCWKVPVVRVCVYNQSQ